MKLPAALWPRSLAGRLTLFLVIALAVAQLGLTVLLGTQRDRLVEELLHSQSLNQAVTLARLLNAYPKSEAPRLVDAFGARQACAWVSDTPPAKHTMSPPERELAESLQAMLHGINTAGTPIVAVEPAVGGRGACGGDEPPRVESEAHEGGDDWLDLDDDGRSANITMNVPLLDGRWLGLRTRVELPSEYDPATILSFLLSSAAVALVVAFVVRHQTRSLRALADASERLGRGEQVPSLPTGGPIEVSTATRAFNIMQERLGEFLRDRLRLLASISHDLRTPITTLRLKAEFIDDEAVREDLIATIDELATICEATLAFTRAEATSEDTKVVDLGGLVHDVTREFELAGGAVDERRMDAPRCACRPVALKRAIRNLVENALRYGGTAHVSVITEAGHAVIRVDDEGPGIPADRIAEAFQPFVRLEPSRSTETGGIGLGLAIARSIVTAHGGSLDLANLPGRGLRAEIRLPLQAS